MTRIFNLLKRVQEEKSMVAKADHHIEDTKLSPVHQNWPDLLNLGASSVEQDTRGKQDKTRCRGKRDKTRCRGKRDNKRRRGQDETRQGEGARQDVRCESNSSRTLLFFIHVLLVSLFSSIFYLGLSWWGKSRKIQDVGCGAILYHSCFVSLTLLFCLLSRTI